MFCLMAVACFGALDTSVKFVGASISAVTALWIRYLFQTVATAVTVVPVRGRSAWRTAHPRFQVLRGLLLLGSSTLGFFSLRHMPVGEFTAIVMITPLVITLIAAVFLKEQVSTTRWLLVAGGFIGVLMIIRPGDDVFSWASLLPLALVGSNAWFQVLTSRMARTEDPLTMHLYTGCICLAATSVLVPLSWTPPGDATVWMALCVMGIMGAVGHFLLIVAYKHAHASTITPFLYAQIAFAMIGGWVVFGHVPDSWSIGGMLLVACCGAGGAWLTARESRISLQATET